MPNYEVAKSILGRFPFAVLRSQPASDWSGDYPLPADVAEYYAELGPVDIWIEDYGNPHFLPSLATLWAHQIGYRTHGTTHERLRDWEDDWLVIADQGGDPFIFSRSRGVVLHAYHGEGVWAPTEMFATLAEMVTTLAILGEVVESAGPDLTDADSLIRQPYRMQAHTRVADFVGSRERAHTIVKTLGWGQD